MDGKSLFIRSVFEVYLDNVFGSAFVFKLRSVNVKCYENFDLFWQQLKGKLQIKKETDTNDMWKEIEFPKDAEQTLRKMVNDYQSRSKQIAIWIALQTCLASLIEELVVLDRIQYLKESGKVKQSALVSLFDPSLSPRNLCIVASKKSFDFSKENSKEERKS